MIFEMVHVAMKLASTEELLVHKPKPRLQSTQKIRNNARCLSQKLLQRKHRVKL